MENRTVSIVVIANNRGISIRKYYEGEIEIYNKELKEEDLTHDERRAILKAMGLID